MPGKRTRIILLALLFSVQVQVHGQVKVRIFTEANPDYFFFKVEKGSYLIKINEDHVLKLTSGDIALVSRYNDRLLFKTMDRPGIMADSVRFMHNSGDDEFGLSITSGEYLSRSFTGDLICTPDFGGILLINNCNIEDYVAGVVKAEGGNGKSLEYFMVQAVIARTYTYRNFTKHMADGYNLCDDTHCQVFGGMISDSLILMAVNATRDKVIATPDSVMIVSAFHSNCGGETSPSEDVWLTGQTYLVSVKDPYCLQSKNSRWEKTVSLSDWIAMLEENGIKEHGSEAASFTFSQPVRAQAYKTGNISLPLRNIREYFNLRSSFFNVVPGGNQLLLDGRGYGHGVGLCQEGAMVMARSGKTFLEIIGFYYPGVIIIDVSEAKKDPDNLTMPVNSYAN